MHLEMLEFFIGKRLHSILQLPAVLEVHGESLYVQSHQQPTKLWNPSSTDTFGSIKCVLSREVSSFQGANKYEVGTYMVKCPD